MASPVDSARGAPASVAGSRPVAGTPSNKDNSIKDTISSVAASSRQTGAWNRCTALFTKAMTWVRSLVSSLFSLFSNKGIEKPLEKNDNDVDSTKIYISQYYHEQPRLRTSC